LIFWLLLVALAVAVFLAAAVQVLAVIELPLEHRVAVLVPNLL
jgi:hypothetical protein